MRTEDLLVNGHLAVQYTDQRTHKVRADVKSIRENPLGKVTTAQRPTRLSFVWRVVFRLQPTANSQSIAAKYDKFGQISDIGLVNR